MERHLRVFKLSEAGVSQVWNVDATEMYTTKQRDTLCVFLTFSRFPCVIIVGGGGGVVVGGDYCGRRTLLGMSGRRCLARREPRLTTRAALTRLRLPQRL